MHAPQRLFFYKTLKRFDTQGEFPHGKAAFLTQSSFAQPRQIVGEGVLGTIDDAQVFRAPALERRLDDAVATNLI